MVESKCSNKVWGMDIYDDHDGIPTSVELSAGLNPYYAGDAQGDLDHDGLSNLFEYQHNLSMTQADTDHDGIDDVKELHYRNVTRGPPLKESISNCRNTNVEKD